MIYLEFNHKTRRCRAVSRNGSSRDIDYTATMKRFDKLQPGEPVIFNGNQYLPMKLAGSEQVSFLILEPGSSGPDFVFDINGVNLANRVFDNCQHAQEICYHAVRMSTELLEVDCASILLLSADQSEVIGTWSIDSEGNVKDETAIRQPLSSNHWMEEALSYKGQLLVKDLVEIENRQEAVGQGWSAVHSIYYDDEPLGWYCCDDVSGKPLTNGLKSAISFFGTMIGQWLIRKRHEDNLKDLNANLEREVQRKTEDLYNTILKLKTTQRELVETERTKALSTFTAGVAHEINNPIGFIRGNLSYISKVSSRVLEKIVALENSELRKSIELLRDIDQVIDESVEGLDRVSNIISMLQPLNKLADEERQKFALTQAIEFAIMGLPENDVKIVIDDSLGNPVVSLPLQITTLAIENILQNAIDAVSGNDHAMITVRIYCETSRLLISCTDNGEGIAKADLDQIFLPFFTTKPPGEGLGLGLSLSQNLIKLAGGNIEAQSEKNLGATLTISFSKEVVVNE